MRRNGTSSRGRTGHLRVTGGSLRSRMISFPVLQGLRPSTDTARCRLFNWLSSRTDLKEAKILDGFCGSGILGIESLSRGAACVDFVDKASAAIRQLEKSLQLLRVVPENYSLHAKDIHQFLTHKNPSNYQVIFLDPPFALSTIYSSLIDWLASDASFSGLVYMECDPSFQAWQFPFESFEIIHDQTRSGVRFLFFRGKGGA